MLEVQVLSGVFFFFIMIEPKTLILKHNEVRPSSITSTEFYYYDLILVLGEDGNLHMLKTRFGERGSFVKNNDIKLLPLIKKVISV